MRIAVLGAGAWGTALALRLARHAPVVLWTRSAEHAESMAQERENRRYLPGHLLPLEIGVSADLASVIGQAELLVVAVPSNAFRALATALRELGAATPLVWLCKGLETGSQKLPQRIFGAIADRVHAGQPFCRLALTVAAWLRFLLGKSEAGQSYEISDPLAARLGLLAAESGGDNALLVEKLLAVREVFPAELAENPLVVSEIRKAVDALQRLGARGAARLYA